jgi:hypothetical protein
VPQAVTLISISLSIGFLRSLSSTACAFAVLNLLIGHHAGNLVGVFQVFDVAALARLAREPMRWMRDCLGAALQSSNGPPTKTRTSHLDVDVYCTAFELRSRRNSLVCRVHALMEIYEEQTEEYRSGVLRRKVKARVAVGGFNAWLGAICWTVGSGNRA